MHLELRALKCCLCEIMRYCELWHRGAKVMPHTPASENDDDTKALG